MAPRSDLLDHYKLDAIQIGDSVIHYSYRSDRARGLRKVKVEERWNNVRPIGYGSFGEVWQQKRNDSNEHRAVKVLRKHQMKSWRIDYEREIEALARFNTAQFGQEEVIVQFFGWWESEHSVHLAMEYFEMRDLSTFISEAKTSEQDAKDIAEDLLQALVMIHSQGYTHRDLKPQNIFVVQTSPRYWVKLGDFGISKRVLNQSTALRTEVGTRAFSAPETIPDDYEETFQYTNAVDMWSLGCVIYNILAHSLPYNNSRAKSLPFPTQPLKDRVDSQGINLLECLLRVDPSTRWTAQEAVKHPWLEASGEASFAAAEDAAGIAKSVAQPERPNESQDKPIRPDEQVHMPTFISSMEKTCPKPTDQTETPINQLISQSPEFRGKNGQSVSRSDNDGRRRTTSNTLILPRYRVSDSFEDPGTETLTPRRARSRSPKDASRGLHESDTMKKPTSSPVTPTIVSRPPRPISELADTSASRDRASSLDTTNPSWAYLLGELKSMGITEDEIKENRDFIRDYIQQRKARGEPTPSPVTPTIVFRPPQRMSELANTSASRDRASSLDTTDPSWAGILEELKIMGITEDQIEENVDFIRDCIQQRKVRGEPTPSPVTPTIVSRPSSTRLGMLSSSSYDVDEGATQKEPLVKMHHNSVAVRGHQGLEKQSTENMDLHATLHPIHTNGDLLTILLHHIFTQKGDPEEIQIAIALDLIRKGFIPKKRGHCGRPVHLAVRICISKKAGHGVQILRELLERGDHVNARDELGDTALHIAVLYKQGNLYENEIEVVRQLLRYKADVNAKALLSATPLHYAAQHSRGESIDVLLDAGARVNKLDDFRQTALHYAALNKDHGAFIARKLIIAKININSINLRSMTALDMAREQGNSGVVEVIEEAQRKPSSIPQERKRRS